MFAWTAMSIVGLLFLIPPASAQTDSTAPPAAPSTDSPVRTVPTVPGPPQSEDPRHTFHRVPDGYLRLDSKTGHVALCSRRQVGWACQILPDDRAAFEAEIARLQVENGALKKALLSRDIPLPGGVRPAAKSQSDSKPASGSVFNQFITVMSDTWQRLVEVVAKIQRDIAKDG